MTLNDTPNAQRFHIGIFGRRNSGKSSILNALCAQQVSIVSDVAGTTTDPVSKAMELLPLGAVLFFDTPGIDDEGMLGAQRVARTRTVLRKCDAAIIVCDAARGMGESETELCRECEKRHIAYITVMNKCDLKRCDGFCVSAKTREGIEELKEKIGALKNDDDTALLSGIIKAGERVILVTPIDSSAPRGRIILPQQQLLREVLDNNALATVVQPSMLRDALGLMKPRMVITDSQAFEEVSKIVPETIDLTSFSILLARKKGVLKASIEGAHVLDSLDGGDKILICEGCTHHRQCNDIGTVKLPKWIEAHSGKTLSFSYTSGLEFLDDVSSFRLIIHCGGCMLNDREVRFRYACAKEQGVPITNYGIAIAHLKGILQRASKCIE